MKAAKMRGSSATDLNNQLQEKQVALGQLYTEQRTKEQRQVHKFGDLRRDIARLKTVLREQALSTEETQDV